VAIFRANGVDVYLDLNAHQRAARVQWDHSQRRRRPPARAEEAAHAKLAAQLAAAPAGIEVTLAGSLDQQGHGYFLHVRTYLEHADRG
jgi:hypothetical protein